MKALRAHFYLLEEILFLLAFSDLGSLKKKKGSLKWSSLYSFNILKMFRCYSSLPISLNSCCVGTVAAIARQTEKALYLLP